MASPDKMRAVELLVLCTFPLVWALDIFIEGPALLLNCRSHGGSHMVESTSIINEAPVSPEEFFAAAKDGDLSIINTAISQLSTSGLDLNWNNTDHSGYTAVHIAAEKDQPSIVTALLDAGADPDVQTDDGDTPMHIAAREYHISVLRLLLDHKYQANVNLQNDSGWTPVYAAARWSITAALELLLAKSGDPNRGNNYGTSPLMRVSGNGYPEEVRMLIQAGAHVNYVRPLDGINALHVAAGNNKADAVLQLLENGADKNKQNNNSKTAADEARDRGYESVAQLIDNY